MVHLALLGLGGVRHDPGYGLMADQPPLGKGAKEAKSVMATSRREPPTSQVLRDVGVLAFRVINPAPAHCWRRQWVLETREG